MRLFFYSYLGSKRKNDRARAAAKDSAGLLFKTMLLIASALWVFLAASCSRQINENIERGSGYAYQQGHPEVRISAIGLFDEEGDPGIFVNADIVYGSLIYKEMDGVQTAEITVEIRMVETGGETEQPAVTETFNLSVDGKEKDLSNSQEVLKLEKRFPVEPGNYDVYVTVMDRSSGKQTTRVTSALLPDADVRHPVLTNIQLLGKDNEGESRDFVPITTYDVPGSVDSLKFIFQVTNRVENRRVTIQSDLIRFASDTIYARSMGSANPSPSTIQYKGIDYDDTETIQSSRRVLTQTGSVLVEFVFPKQSRGNYRFRSRITDASNNESDTFKARDFGIKSKNFPAIKSARELARPLVYLMGDKEYENLIRIKSPDSLKLAVDRFWLRNIGDREKARQVIARYYGLVEEANKQYSNFKEGWKTDPGMIYILFGRPLYLDRYINRMTWFYSYNREDPRTTFHFIKPELKTPSYPFDHYLLNRKFFYENLEYQQRQRWLNGLILNTNI